MSRFPSPSRGSITGSRRSRIGFLSMPLLGCALFLLSVPVMASERFPGVGRAATAAEIQAWDIDVRPDFKGLPRGAGTVAKGQDVWDEKCAGCHGTFGESNEVFTPIVGGTTKEDIATGRVGGLVGGNVPHRTTLMKLSTVSTLWDYVNRAMPWNAPKTLTVEEVYAVVAYMLHLGEIVPADFTLSDKNIAEVQRLLPNRNGMTLDHGLRDVKGKPDTRNTACMKDCKTEVALGSELPEHAKGTHGNLAEQNRVVGPVRGQKTAPASAEPAKAVATPAGLHAMKKQGCGACHGVANKIVGPGFTEIAAKYKSDASASAKLAERVKAGGSGVWGSVPMPPQAQIADDDVKTIIAWILAGAVEK